MSVRGEPAIGAVRSGFDAQTPLAAALHIVVAFDWGEGVDIQRARSLSPSEVQVLARRRRTPASLSYRPSPLVFPLPRVPLVLAELGAVDAAADATLFHFGAVSVAMRVPLSLPAGALARLAAGLADPQPLVSAARMAMEPLYKRLLPSIEKPDWSESSEEYFVFQLLPDAALPPPEELLASHAGWLAGLLRLDAEPLSADEVAESLRLRLSYSPADLFVAEWSAAVLVDQDCDETLQIIELANLQLMEFRHLDTRLDERLDEAYRLIRPLAHTWLPVWRTQARPLRALGELKVTANALFDRTTNVLKLVGDQYLARVYRMVAARFHLDDWQRSIQGSLQVVQGVHQVVADQSATYRTELLETIIILLIAWEVFITLADRW